MADHATSDMEITSSAPFLPATWKFDDALALNSNPDRAVPAPATSPFRGLHGRLEEIIDAPVTKFSNSNLPLIRNAIRHLKEIKQKLYEDEYAKMAENTIKRANTRLANATFDETEPLTSCLYPRDCLWELERITGLDKTFMEVLLRSGRVKECKWPTFSGFTDWTRGAPEYQFMIGFEFGFSFEKVLETVHDGCRKIDVPEEVCAIIADFVGDSYFEIKLTVYFDKTKDDWNEQDGEAWIFHKGGRGKVEDVVNFDKDDRIYYVEHWPLKGLVVATDEDAPEEQIVSLERKLVAWLCCQMIWLVLGENLSPNYCHSFVVRNAVKKLIFVLKGWFTGLLLGESFEPEGISFESAEQDQLGSREGYPSTSGPASGWRKVE